MTGSHRYRLTAGKGLEHRIDYSHVSDALFRCDTVRLTEPERLSGKRRESIENPANAVFVSAVSIAEVAMKAWSRMCVSRSSFTHWRVAAASGVSTSASPSGKLTVASAAVAGQRCQLREVTPVEQRGHPDRATRVSAGYQRSPRAPRAGHDGGEEFGTSAASAASGRLAMPHVSELPMPSRSW